MNVEKETGRETRPPRRVMTWKRKRGRERIKYFSIIFILLGDIKLTVIIDEKDKDNFYIIIPMDISPLCIVLA